MTAEVATAEVFTMIIPEPSPEPSAEGEGTTSPGPRRSRALIQAAAAPACLRLPPNEPRCRPPGPFPGRSCRRQRAALRLP